MQEKKKAWPALKHGAFAKTAVLPGEDAAAFNKLRKDLLAEFLPCGTFETDIVEDLARLSWRKRNLGTYYLAELARQRYVTIEQESKPPNRFDDPDKEEREAAHSVAIERARKELGPGFQLVLMGEAATLEHHAKQITVEERLEARIDRALRRLLFVRGLKSMPSSKSS